MKIKKIIAKVVSNNVKFSEFYNSVITLRIAEELSLTVISSTQSSSFDINHDLKSPLNVETPT